MRERRRSIMRSGRRARTISKFLLLGAIVNVAVAWGCVLARPYPSQATIPLPLQTACSEQDRQDLALIGVRPKDSSDPVWEFVFVTYAVNGGGWTQRQVFEVEDLRPGCSFRGSRLTGLHPVATFVESGWPCSSLEGFRYLDRASIWRVANAIDVTAYKEWTGNWAILPFHPLPRGFAMNTTFYAAILWLLFSAIGVIRRRVRTKIRRNHCFACGYPIGASPVCTECGKPVKPRQAEAAA